MDFTSVSLTSGRLAGPPGRQGGHLLVLGRDRENLTRGIGGPQDPDAVYDPELLAGAASGWRTSRLERIDRDTDSGTAVDTLLFAQRP